MRAGLVARPLFIISVTIPKLIIVKKLLILISLLVFILPSNAQDIKVRRVKKVKIEAKVIHAEFGANSKEIIFPGPNKQERSLYNTKTKNIETIPAPIAPSTQVKVSGNKIILFENGQEVKTLQPAGDTYYIWPSLSPDKKHILFTAIRKGTFICDLEGKIIKELGELNAPSWINNEWVLGMDEEYDGHTAISSEVYAIHYPSSKKIEISSRTDEIAIFPRASSDASTILFHNPKGELFVTNIKLKK